MTKVNKSEGKLPRLLEGWKFMSIFWLQLLFAIYYLLLALNFAAAMDDGMVTFMLGHHFEELQEGSQKIRSSQAKKNLFCRKLKSRPFLQLHAC